MKKLLKLLDDFFGNTFFPWLERIIEKSGLPDNPWVSGLGFSVGLISPIVIQKLLSP